MIFNNKYFELIIFRIYAFASLYYSKLIKDTYEYKLVFFDLSPLLPVPTAPPPPLPAPPSSGGLLILPPPTPPNLVPKHPVNRLRIKYNYEENNIC